MEFRHEALLYSNHAEFLGGAVPFLREGMASGEAILVVESRERIDLLRGALGDDAAQVMFADMAAVGSNPARIIPAWREFVEVHGANGKGLRGIGEPIWKERSADELVECQRHESLLNVAFADGRPWHLLCPYDTTRLDPAVIAEARRSHRYVTEGGVSATSAEFRGVDACGSHFATPLEEPRRGVRSTTFDRDGLLELRRRVTRFATWAGLPKSRATAMVTAVNEVATNSVQHGGGKGTLRMWKADGALVCEVRDAGAYDHALADRNRPGPRIDDSRGLWIANQLCDLVQIRTFPEGTVVRLHTRLDTN